MSLGDARPEQWRSSRFRIVALSDRPTMTALFGDMARQSRGAVSVLVIPLEARAVGDAADALASASVAVIDASVDTGEAVAVCAALRAEHATLSISAVFCCPHAAAAADLRGLLAAGVGGLVDLQLSADETLRVLRSVAHGHGAFHLQLAAGSKTSLAEWLSQDGGTSDLTEPDLTLLRLVALGLSDHEIGRRLYISHHTVKHRIDRLRRRVNARNRIQLAAWAGGQAALRNDPGPALDAEPVAPIMRLPGRRDVDGHSPLCRPG